MMKPSSENRYLFGRQEIFMLVAGAAILSSIVMLFSKFFIW